MEENQSFFPQVSQDRYDRQGNYFWENDKNKKVEEGNKTLTYFSFIQFTGEHL